MAQINIKVDDQLKDDVSKIFAEMGIDLTSGIKIYLKKFSKLKKSRLSSPARRPKPITTQITLISFYWH